MIIKNFLFHRVSPERDSLWDPMDTILFDKCIKKITKKYKVVLFEELALKLKNIQPISKEKYATIMFDDGYKDNIKYALPILEKYKVKASFYVVTNCIDNNIPTWTHHFDYLFQHTEKLKIKLDFDFLNDKYKENNFRTKEERISLAKEFKPYLKKLTHQERELVIKQISNQFNDATLPPLMMNWDDLKILKNNGHYIGSHTVNHFLLGTIKNEDLIKQELLVSMQLIESKLGHQPITISYPVGSYNDSVKKISKEVGYDFGLAVKQDVWNTNNNNFYDIERIELYNESWFKTKLRISHLLEKLKKMISYS